MERSDWLRRNWWVYWLTFRLKPQAYSLQSPVIVRQVGISMIYNAPVSQVIATRFLASLLLMATAWTIGGLLGFVPSVTAGAMPGSLLDQGIRFYAYTLASTPTFWLALLLLIVYSVGLRLTPICCAAPIGIPPEQVTVWRRIHHLLLPAAALSVLGVANSALHIRLKLAEVLESNYILFARARGKRRWGLIWHHALRHVLLPAITLQFQQFTNHTRSRKERAGFLSYLRAFAAAREAKS